MRDQPEVKVLQYGDKKIILAPDGIFMIAVGTFISLSDQAGVKIVTDRDIRLQAEENILIEAAGEINVIGGGGVKLKSESTSIEMDEDIVIEGQEIKTN